MHFKNTHTLLATGILAFALVGCGGGGSGDTPDTSNTGTHSSSTSGSNNGGNNGSTNNGGTSSAKTVAGNFRDTNVIGLKYQSGAIHGLTGENGSYQCEEGNTVTFSVGSVVLGTVACSSLTTPVDLVQNGTVNSTAVLNITRFLLALDEDNDPSNEITISEETRQEAQNWQNIDFASENFDQQFQENVSGYQLPSMETAKQHLETTLMCAYSGAFKGIYDGDDNGEVGVLISPKDGKTYILGYSDNLGGYFTTRTPYPLHLDTMTVSGSVNTGAKFDGTIDSPDSMSGQWSLNQGGGSWEVHRIAGIPNAHYRVVGTFVADNGAGGLYSIDIDNEGKISGLAYDTSDNHTYKISGTYSNGTIHANADDGTEISANYDPSTGEISNAQLSDVHGENYQGTFYGSGCTLNGAQN